MFKLLKNPAISSFQDEAALREAYAEGRASAPIPNLPLNFPIAKGYSYYPYQLAGIQLISKRLKTTQGNAVLLADEMGLGKTLQAIGYINATRVQKVLVLCPKILVDEAWYTGFKKFLARPLTIKIIGQDRDLDFEDANIFIANYDKLVGAEGLRFCNEIRSNDWDLLILDECQAVKNPEAQRTIRIFGSEGTQSQEHIYPGIIGAFKEKIFMTGTPIESSPVNAWRVLSACEPGLFGSKWDFGKRYCNLHKTSYGWDWSGRSNESELNVLMYANCAIRRLKRDVLKLPQKEHTIYEFTVDSATRQAIEQLNEESEIDDFVDSLTKNENLLIKFENEFIKKLEESEESDDFNEDTELDSMLSQSGLHDLDVRFQNIAGYRSKLAALKLPYACAYVQKLLDTGEKVVVFAWHRTVIEGLIKHFQKYNPVFAYGGKKSKNLSLTFETDDSCRLFIGQIKSAGAGITLTKARVAVFVEMDFTPGVMAQAEDRIHRIGQTKQCNIVYLTMPNTIDGKLANTLVRKFSTIKAVLEQDIGKEEDKISSIYRIKKAEEQQIKAATDSIDKFRENKNLIRDILADIYANHGREIANHFLRNVTSSFFDMRRQRRSITSDKQLKLAVDVMMQLKSFIPEAQFNSLGITIPDTPDTRICKAIQDIEIVDPRSKSWWIQFRNDMTSRMSLSDQQRRICLEYMSNYRNQVQENYISEFIGILPPPDEFLIGLTEHYITLLKQVITFCYIAKLTDDKDLVRFAMHKSSGEDSKKIKDIAKTLEDLSQKNDLLKCVSNYINSPALYNSRILTRALEIQKEYEEVGASPLLTIDEAKDKATNEILRQFGGEAFYPPEVKAAATQAMKMLAGVCNYASTWDNQGFNKVHAKFGHYLAEKFDEIPDIYMPFALFCVTFYKRQLGSMLLERAGISGEDLAIAKEFERKREKKAQKEAEKTVLKETVKQVRDNRVFWSTSFGQYLKGLVG